MDTMRQRFTAVAAELLDTDPRLALVLADVGVANFRATGVLQRHPDRVFNVGIREQLLVSFAAGLALEGFRPIVHSFAAFLVERPFEQVKLDLGHQGVGAILVSAYASYDWAAGGRTHQAPGDVGLMATLPDWRIHVPGHPDEAEKLLRSEAAAQGRAYIRLSEESNSHAVETVPGRMAVVRRGSARAPVVIAIGPTLSRVLDATGDLDFTVLYAVTVRPFDYESLRSVLGAHEIVLVEPYLEGTSSAEVSAALVDTPHRLLAIGVPNTEFRHYGTAAEHAAAHRLDSRGMRERVAAFLRLPAAV